jgi:AcrR family transcriptional regulator
MTSSIEQHTSTNGPATRRGPGSGIRTAESIRAAAVELFYSHGFESTSLRQIAAEVGIQVGSLYNHIPSKEFLLHEIMSSVIEDLLAALEASLDDLTDPADRLSAAVQTHVMFHAERAKEVFIGNSELRSLADDHRHDVVALRDRYEQHIVTIIDDGMKTGAFVQADAKLLAYAIVSIGTQVSNWYRAGGKYELSTISAEYVQFILRGLSTVDPSSSAE